MATEFRSHLETIVEQATRALDSLGVQWAVVGGLAVSARAEPRFTRDADLAVAVSDDRMAERLIHDLRERGYRAIAHLEHEVTHRLATVRLHPPAIDEHGIVLDLLFASSGIEPEIVHTATSLEVFPGMHLPVARIGELLALKILAYDDDRRPQDRSDIMALLKKASAADLAAAEGALRLILERGCDRKRDLLADFERFVQLKQVP